MNLRDRTRDLYFLQFTILPLLAGVMLAAVDGFFLDGVATKAPAAVYRYASLLPAPDALPTLATELRAAATAIRALSTRAA